MKSEAKSEFSRLGNDLVREKRNAFVIIGNGYFTSRVQYVFVKASD